MRVDAEPQLMLGQTLGSQDVHTQDNFVEYAEQRSSGVSSGIRNNTGTKKGLDS